MTEPAFPCAIVICREDSILLKVLSDEGAKLCFSGISWGVDFTRNPKATPVEYPIGVNKPAPKTTSGGYQIYDKHRSYSEFLHDDCLIILASNNKLWDGLSSIFLEYDGRTIDSQDVSDLNWSCFKLTGIPDHVFWF